MQLNIRPLASLPLVWTVRRRYGLRLASWHPFTRARVRSIAIDIAAVLLFVGLVGTLQARDAQAEAATQEAATERGWKEIAVALLNGRAVSNPEGTWAARCSAVIEARQ